MQSGSSTRDNSTLEDVDVAPPTSRRGVRWFRALTILGIPLIAILVFLSRPIASFIARQACYHFRGSIDYSFNPTTWSWHNNPLNAGRHWLGSLYECEWTGYLGFNWPNVLEWIRDRGSAIVSSLGLLGGGYATWRSVKAWFFNKNQLNEEEKHKIKALARQVSLEHKPGRSPSENWVHISDQVLKMTRAKREQEATGSSSSSWESSSSANDSSASSHPPSGRRNKKKRR